MQFSRHFSTPTSTLQASDRAAKVRACLTGYPRGICKPGQDLNFPPKDGPVGKPDDVPRGDGKPEDKPWMGKPEDVPVGKPEDVPRGDGKPEYVPVGKPEDVPWMGKPEDVPRGGSIMPDDLPRGRGQGTPDELPAKGNRLP